LVEFYNNTYNRSIKTKPVDVNIKNEDQVWLNLYGDQKQKLKLKFKIGDNVRLSKSKRAFEKGYTSNWTKEIFVIYQIKKYNIPVYVVKDQMDEIVQGVFYEQELQKVTNTKNTFDFDKILKTRKINGKKEYYISRDGYPSKFNQWVPGTKINLK
jgi:hypothetical protein